MSRKATTHSELDDSDHHGFWDQPAREEFTDELEVDTDLADLAELDSQADGSIGDVTAITADERIVLSEWAESMACGVCTLAIVEHHDPTRLPHDECRTALRVARLLRRYN
jgi:hypothetical protein